MASVTLLILLFVVAAYSIAMRDEGAKYSQVLRLARPAQHRYSEANQRRRCGQSIQQSSPRLDPLPRHLRRLSVFLPVIAEGRLGRGDRDGDTAFSPTNMHAALTIASVALVQTGHPQAC